MGYKHRTTPFIDELAKKGVLFKSAYTNGPGTRFALKSMFCSVYPTQIKGLGLPLDHPPTLAELLKSCGYSTAGFHTNGYLSSSFNYDRGFDVFYDIDMWKSSFFDRIIIETRRLLSDFSRNRLHKTIMFRRGVPHLWRDFKFLNKSLYGDELTGKALRWVKKQGNPFFLWIHFMDVHHPYLIRKQGPKIKRNDRNYLTEGKFTEDELEELIDIYDDQIRYVDTLIEQFLGEVSGFSSRETVSIITSDHGEQFMERGGFHTAVPYQEMVHVPLIMAGNGMPEDMEIDTPVSHIDLVPTVMDMIGHQAGWWAEGRSLLPCFEKGTMRNKMVFINYGEEKKEVRAILDNEKKLVFEVKSGTWEFYDLVSDPFERNNLYEEGDAVQEEMKRKMEEKNYAAKSKASYMVKETDVSKHVVDQLKALGYLD